MIQIQHDLEIIEALDFDYTPECESTGHDSDVPHDEGGAYALVRVEQDCGHHFDKFYCKTFTQHLTGPLARTYCFMCGAPNLTPASATIISLVN